MEWISGNIFIRPNVMDKVGDKCGNHTHNFDHTTIVFQGRVRVKAYRANEDGSPGEFICERTFGGPEDETRHFLVKARVCHDIEALEPNTIFWCVYSHRTPQGEVTTINTGWQDAYC